MGDAPARIWLDWPDANRGEAVYDEPPERETQPGQTEYLRADIAAAREAELRAEVERLTQANREAAMQSLADLGQAQEALDRALAAEAKLKKRNSVIAKVYGRITNIADDLDDQGDRVFLGSTNDADMLRSLRDEWIESRVLKVNIATPEEEVANLRTRLRREVAAAEAAALDRAADTAKTARDVYSEACNHTHDAVSYMEQLIRAFPRDGSALDAVVAERTKELREAVEVLRDIADPKRLTSHGDPTVLRDHARAALAKLGEKK